MASAPAQAPPRFRVIDGVMILLALVSVSLVLTDIFARGWLYQKGLFAWVILVDATITAVFLADFLVESRGERIGQILKGRWFDIVGLLPMAAFVALEAQLLGVPLWPALTGAATLGGGAAASGGLLRLFRLVRIVRIVQAFSRFLRATNMTFGEQVTKRFFDKYRRIIVAELTTPIMVAGISVTQEIVVRMKFLESAGKALDAKRPEVHAAVLEALKKNRATDAFLSTPIAEKVVMEVEKAVMDTVVDTLTGPELNKLVQEMIVEVLGNFKEQLKSPEGKAALKRLGDDSVGVPVQGAPDAKALEGPSAF